MHLSVFVLLAGASVSLAAKASTLCYTTLGSKAALAKLPTSSTTTTTPCTNTVTSIVTVISTSATTVVKTTKTVTGSVVTASTSTNVHTVTAFSTKTVSSTITDTSTSTVTESKDVTSTSTVPASAGFTPVQSSLPDSSYSGQAGSSPAKVRRGRTLSKGSVSKGHPQAVQCLVVEAAAKCKETTITSRTTIHSAGATSTKTVKTTVHPTTVPSATTTTTVSSTVTSTAFSTTTSVTTTTTTAPNVVSSTTIYEACATNNFADTVGGQPIGGIDAYYDEYPFEQYGLANGPGSAYECCVTGLMSTTDCSVWQFYPQANACFIIPVSSSGNEPESQSDEYWQVTNTHPSQPLIVGNLYWGQVNRNAAQQSRAPSQHPPPGPSASASAVAS